MKKQLIYPERQTASMSTVEVRCEVEVPMQTFEKRKKKFIQSAMKIAKVAREVGAQNIPASPILSSGQILESLLRPMFF